MLRILLAVSLAAICIGSDEEMTFEQFKAVFGKQYSIETGEEAYRRSVFEYHVELINRHNAEAADGLHSYTLGVNEYADMDNEEFREVMLGYRMNNDNPRILNDSHMPTVSQGSLPDSVDWRKKGYVTPVKNQGQCGSCWAFSATGSLEGQHFNKTGKLVSLSEQNLVDCSHKQGNDGCDGGMMDMAFKYVKVNHGIDTEAAYPYTAQDDPCRFKRSAVGATLTSWRDVKKGSERALQEAVAGVGPVSVAIDASHSSFHLYKRGVYNEPRCSTTALDHGVLAVGYGTEGGRKYWLVKNSWAKSWGEKGYIKMSRDKHNQCGIATSASYPIV